MYICRRQEHREKKVRRVQTSRGKTQIQHTTHQIHKVTVALTVTNGRLTVSQKSSWRNLWQSQIISAKILRRQRTTILAVNRVSWRRLHVRETERRTEHTQSET
jgi:hypothetical protein